MDRHIKIADGHHITAEQKVQVQIKMCDNNGDPFIVTLHNATDYFLSLLMNSGHTFLFNK